MRGEQQEMRLLAAVVSDGTNLRWIIDSNRALYRERRPIFQQSLEIVQAMHGVPHEGV